MNKGNWLLAALVIGGCTPDPEQPAPEPVPPPPPAAVEVEVDNAAEAEVAVVPEVAGLPDDEVLQRGRQVVEWLFAGNFDQLWPLFDEEVRAQAGSAETFGSVVTQIFQQTGPETAVVEEEIHDSDLRPGLRIYRREGEYALLETNANLIVAFNADGTIAGINIQPAQ